LVDNQPQLTTTNSLTGSGAHISVPTLQDGNPLGRYYQLGYKGVKTSRIYPIASITEISAALRPVVGGVSVAQILPASTEGGRAYSITFDDLTGDLALLDSYYNGTLTGKNAVVSVYETVKGSRAQGNTLKLLFDAPLHYSMSQVEMGNCGASADFYQIDVGTAG